MGRPGRRGDGVQESEPSYYCTALMSRAMEPIGWHRRETRRPTENTNRFLRVGERKCRKSVESKPALREGGQEGRDERFKLMQRTEITDSIVRATARPETGPDDSRTWSWVEASVWTERMLAALGNGVRGGKWHSLVDKVYAPQTLWAAWQRVAANQGAAGIEAGGSRVGVHGRLGLFSRLENGGPFSLKKQEVRHHAPWLK